MNRRILATTVLLASSLCASQAVFASSVVVPVHAMSGKVKLVSFSMRNDTTTPLKLKAGDTLMTIDAGKTLPLKLPVGTSVTTQEAITHFAVGDTVAQVTPDLSGVTISIK